MKKTFLLILIVVMCFSMFSIFTFALSEPPAVEWYKTYGGIDAERMYWGHRSVIETSDGGYAIAGRTYSFGAGGGDFWLVKTDANGDMQWNRTYGRLYDDVAESVIQTSDSGYAIAGASWNISRRAHDLFLVKTDANGDMEWNLTYIRDNSGGYLDWGHAACVIQTIDGGYIISGSVRHHPDHPTGDWDGWLVKTDANGNVEWDKPYGGGADEGAHSVLQTVDGGYIFVGTTLSYGAGSGDAWLVKTNAKGNQQWAKTFGGSNWDDGWTISKTLDEGYIIGGVTSSFGAGGYDFWLVKTDANGNQQWAESYGGANEDYGWSVIETEGGGYALAGYTKSFGAGGSDFWLVETDSFGSQEWNKTFGGANDDEARSVVQTSDGGYVVAGFTNSFGAGSHDFLLIKLSPTPPVMTATIDIDPDTLNIKSKRKWITAYIELPEGYNVSDIDVSSISLNNTLSVDPDTPREIGDYDNDTIPDFMVKFNGTEVASYILNAINITELIKERHVNVTLTLTGKLYDETLFQGRDAIRVVGPKTSLSLSCRSSTSYVGFKVEIKGNLTSNGDRLSGIPILLSYSVTGGESWEDLTLVYTATEADFSAVWMPSVTGNYLIKATWAGNATYPEISMIVNLAVAPFKEQNVFSVTSNSTVSSLAFNSTSRELSFIVTGPSGTTGYVDVYLAKTLIENVADVRVYLNSDQLNYTATSLDDSWLLHFTYQHSTHKITVSLGAISAPFTETPLGKAVIYGIPLTALVVLIIIYFFKRHR